MATLKAMFRLFDGYSTTIDKINKKTDDATDKILKASGQTDKFNQKLEQTGASASTASSGLGKFLSITAAIAASIKGMSIADEYVNTSARLDLINDGLQTQLELQDKIFAAADRSKGSYSDMADAVAKMELLAGDAFSSNDETIAFTELMQKSFKLGGADKSTQQGAMRQLTQAMASGRLQGDELVSIMEGAPMLYDAIAKYMGVSKGELKELGSQGLITSNIIKNAMFMAGADINEMFEGLPDTFGDVWNRIKDGALKAFRPVIEKVNAIINTDKFQKSIDNVIAGINRIATGVSLTIDVIEKGWWIIEPILHILAFMYLSTIAIKLWAMVPPVVAQAVAWLGVYWPVLAVAAAIGVVIYALKEAGVTSEDTFNVMGGAFGGFIANVNNGIAYLWNPVASFINFFVNSFHNFGASLEIFFWDIVYTVISGVNSMIGGVTSALNMLPGVNIDATSDYDKVLADIDKRRSKLKADSGWEEIVKSIEFIDSETAMRGGGALFNNIADKLSGKLDEALNKLSGNDPNDYLNDNILTVQGTGKNGSIEVDMSDEDLQYLRDVAERDYVNKFSTATLAPQVVFNISDIKETADLEQLMGRLETLMSEEIATVAEGEYDV